VILLTLVLTHKAVTGVVILEQEEVWVVEAVVVLLRLINLEAVEVQEDILEMVVEVVTVVVLLLVAVLLGLEAVAVAVLAVLVVLVGLLVEVG
jgi:hypothetical protein